MIDGTPDELHRIADKVEGFRNALFNMGQPAQFDHWFPKSDLSAVPEGCVYLDWDELGRDRQRQILERHVDWDRFTPSDMNRVIANVQAGDERGKLFEGVDIEDAVRAEWLKQHLSLTPSLDSPELTDESFENLKRVLSPSDLEKGQWVLLDLQVEEFSESGKGCNG